MVTHRVWLALLAVVAVAVLAYADVSTLGLVYDDHRLVSRNPALDGSWGALFTQDLSGGGGWRIYRPLVAVAWKLERAMAEPVVLHHVVNLFWHVLATGALFGLALVLSPRPRSVLGPAVLAALFAAHPLTSEAVCWVSRRADVMAAGLGLASLFACARSEAAGGTTRRVWAGSAIGLVAGAMLSKEVGAVFPLLWIVTAGVLRSPRRRVVGWALGAGLLIAGYAGLRAALFDSVTDQPVRFVQNWVDGAPGTSRIEVVLGLIAHAARLIVIPHPLSADYSWRSLDPGSWSALPAVGGGLVIAAVVAAVTLGRHRAAVVVGVAILVATYAPVSNGFFSVGTAFAERLLYLPLAGVAIALSAFAHRRAVMIAAIGCTLVALFATRARVPEWRDDDTLFTSVLAAYPDNVVAHTYRGIARREAGDLAAARRHYTAALDVYPDYHLARVNRAFILVEIGEVEEALAEAAWIIEREPEPGAPHLVVAVGELARGHAGEAEAAFWRAAADPAIRPDALAQLAEMYRARGDGAGLERVRRAARARE